MVYMHWLWVIPAYSSFELAHVSPHKKLAINLSGYFTDERHRSQKTESRFSKNVDYGGIW